MNNSRTMGTLAGVTITQTLFNDGGACYVISHGNIEVNYRARRTALKAFIGKALQNIPEKEFDYDDLTVILSVIDPGLVD